MAMKSSTILNYQTIDVLYLIRRCIPSVEEANEKMKSVMQHEYILIDVVMMQAYEDWLRKV